jgi:transposase
MFFRYIPAQVYLATGSTDMRKAINGLSILVAEQLDHDPLSGQLFCFCNKKRSIIKILYWDRNGFSCYAELSIKGKTGSSVVRRKVRKQVPCFTA